MNSKFMTLILFFPFPHSRFLFLSPYFLYKITITFFVIIYNPSMRNFRIVFTVHFIWNSLNPEF